VIVALVPRGPDRSVESHDVQYTLDRAKCPVQRYIQVLHDIDGLWILMDQRSVLWKPYSGILSISGNLDVSRLFVIFSCRDLPQPDCVGRIQCARTFGVHARFLER